MSDYLNVQLFPLLSEKSLIHYTVKNYLEFQVFIIFLFKMFIYLISYFLIRVFFAEDFTLIFNFPPGAFLSGFNKKKVIKIQIVVKIEKD